MHIIAIIAKGKARQASILSLFSNFISVVMTRIIMVSILFSNDCTILRGILMARTQKHINSKDIKKKRDNFSDKEFIVFKYNTAFVTGNQLLSSEIKTSKPSIKKNRQ